MRVKKYLVLFLISFIFILKTVTYPIITVYAGENEFEDVPLEIFESGDVLPSSSATETERDRESTCYKCSSWDCYGHGIGRCFSKKTHTKGCLWLAQQRL